MIVMCCFKAWRQLLNRITCICNNITNSLVIADMLDSLPCSDGSQSLCFAMLVGLWLFQAWK